VKYLRIAAFAAAALIALAACKPAAQDTSADEAALRASAPAWAAAYNAGDADKIASFYGQDAVLQPPNAPAATGPDAIREFIAKNIEEAKTAGLTLNIPEPSAVHVSGDLAFDAGTFSMTDASGATVDTGKYIGVYQKTDGKWLYVRDTWNSDQAPAPAAAPAADAAAAPAT